MWVLGTAVRWNTRPSQLLEIEDAYTAYCFDEACAYIAKKVIDEEKEPTFRATHTSFRDVYAGYNDKGVKYGS